MAAMHLIVFISLCFTLCHSEEESEGQAPMLSHEQIWGFGVLAGVGISSIGFVAALILVVAKKCCNLQNFEVVMKFMFSLSCGALVGDAVVHILAQAYSNTQINPRIVSLIFIASLFLFLIFDRLLHSFGIAHSHWVGEKCEGDRENHGHHHHGLSEHNHNHQLKNDDKQIQQSNTHRNKDQFQQIQQIKHKNKKQKTVIRQSEKKKQVLSNSFKNQNQSKQPESQKITDNFVRSQQLILNKQQQQKEDKGCCHSLKGKGSTGYMNLIGSLIHNFFDGLALGIAFATGDSHQIIPVIIAIIAHEIPRQLGDVAILLRSSFTETQTVLCNGFINFLSLIGVFIGLAVVNMSSAVKQYIMVFVAGNFIYIASDIWQHILKNKGEKAKCSNALQFFGLSVGIGAMFLLTLLEHQEHHQ